MSVYGSSQAFIKTLKGPSDPPSPGGPYKISIATEVWRSSSINFPNKDEVIAEWIFSAFVKDRTSSSDASKILNPSYWALLEEVLSQCNERSTGTWLRPLLNRLPVASIASSWLSRTQSTGKALDVLLVQSFSRCMSKIWAIVVQRTNLDMLTELFGSILTFLWSHSVKDDGLPEEALMSVCMAIVKSFRTSFGNAANKKKTITVFTQQYLPVWLRTIPYRVSQRVVTDSAKVAPGDQDDDIFSEVFSAGTDVLFSLESLKTTQDIFGTSIRDAFTSTPVISNDYLHVLAALFHTFLRAVRKYRFAVFGSSSAEQSQEQAVQGKVRDTSLAAFAGCHELLKQRGDCEEVWRSLLALVEVLENTKVVGSDRIERLSSPGEVLQWATGALAVEQVEERTVKTEIALLVLCTLIRVDVDLVNSCIPTVLSNLLKLTHQLYPESLELLRLQIDFHVKTRTLPVYFTTVISCLESVRTQLTGTSVSDIQASYRVFASSTLFSVPYLENLARAVKGFLTPGQTPEVTNTVLKTLREIWTAFHNRTSESDSPSNSAMGERGRKCQKTYISSVDVLRALAAMSFSLLARFAAVVLPSLPLSTLPTQALINVASTINDAWNTFLGQAAGTAFIGKGDVPPLESWCAQVMSTAALRLIHSLRRSPFQLFLVNESLSNCAPEDEMLKAVLDTATLPEFAIECFRYFFDSALRSGTGTLNEVLSALLCYLQPLVTGSEAASWNTASSALATSGPDAALRGALAALNLTMDVWLPTIDELADSTQLQQFAELFLALVPSLGRFNSHELTPGWVLRRSISSASFWELPNLRDALVQVMDAQIQFLDNVDIVSLLSGTGDKLPRKKSRAKQAVCECTEEQIRDITSVLELLLASPSEYLPRSRRSVFARRTMAAGILTWSRLSAGQEQSTTARKAAVVSFSWLRGLSETQTIIDDTFDPSAVVERIVQPIGVPLITEQLRDAITGWLDILIREIVRSAAHGYDEHLSSICVTLWEHIDVESKLSERSLLQLVDVLLADCSSVGKLSEHAVSAIDSLWMKMSARFSEHLSRTAGDPDLVIAWRTVLRLQHWLGRQDGTQEQWGRRLLSSLKETTPNSLYCSQVFALLCEELRLSDAVLRLTRLELVVAAYVYIHGRLGIADFSVSDSALASVGKTLAPEDYANALALIRDSLAQPSLHTTIELRALVHVASTLNKSSPEGSAKITQDYYGRCLQLFLSCDEYIDRDVSLAREVLDFISIQCSEKPSFLKQADVALIWTILARQLSPSSRPHPCTHAPLLQAMTAITINIIRHRRDLVLPTLPHLAVVLRGLLSALRSPRTQLAPRQAQIVADSLPWWVAPSHPLGAEGARQVARVLTSLETKTIPRLFAHARGGDASISKAKLQSGSQKAESLGRPFSKHAPTVLQAYLAGHTDALCSYSLVVRRELETGLFALCGMMNEHGRDSLMVSALDAGGKVALKTLWREYEKQKYAGKG